MPKNRNQWDPKNTSGPEDKFRSFFTNSAIELPDAMTRRDDEQPERQGLLDKLLHRGGKAAPAKAQGKEDDTGEVMIMIQGEEEEPVADLELAFEPAPSAAAQQSADEQAAAEQRRAEEQAQRAARIAAAAQAAAEAEAEAAQKQAQAEAAAEAAQRQTQAEAAAPAPQPQPAPEPEPAAEPVQPAQPAPAAVPTAVAEPQKPAEKQRVNVRPEEDHEAQQLAELKALLERMSAERAGSGRRAAQPRPVPVQAKAATAAEKPAAPEKPKEPVQQAEPVPEQKTPEAPTQPIQPVEPEPVVQPVKQEVPAPEPQAEEMPVEPVQNVEPEANIQPVEPETPEQPDGISLFGTADDEGIEAAGEGVLPEGAPVSASGMLLFEDEEPAPAGAGAAEPAPVQPETVPAVEPKAPEAETAPAAPEAEPAAEPAAESAAEPAAEPAPEQAEEAAAEAEEPAPDTPEAIAARLKQMSASLTLRCAISGILALVLVALGLSAEGLISPIAGLDPIVAPAAFYAANLLLYAAALFVGRSVIRDGLAGLRGRPSAETMPALAAVGGAVQALAAMLSPHAYAPSSLTLLSGIAALGLFTALLGNRIMLASVISGFELITSGLEQQGAYRLRDKDVIRSLARDLEEKDPWVLLSQPTGWEKNFVEQCFDMRASERRQRKVSLVLLGMAVISGLLFLVFGAGINGMAASAAAVLCMGAPLSSTLIAGITSLRLQRTAGAVGAMVPGWAAVEELGGIDTIQADAGQLFSPECVSLEDIRIFKGGRIDLAILYAASILGPCCATLRGLFSQMIEDRTDLLFPVKDLETHPGLGFSAWCDNNRVLIGTRAYMEQEEVPLPEQEYEDKHSRNGELQILYLAVSGSLHAMFVLKYQGGRNAARGMAILQKDSIRLLVSCQDPSLTAHHIAEAYRLPDWMVTLLDGSQCAAIEAQHKPDDVHCCMLHLKGFASLTGGLHAAEQAQNAENTATTVQIVSVLFSVIIALLLTSAGSIGSLSVVTVLMYQAAWSALSIAVCALKQRG